MVKLDIAGKRGTIDKLLSKLYLNYHGTLAEFDAEYKVLKPECFAHCAASLQLRVCVEITDDSFKKEILLIDSLRSLDIKVIYSSDYTMFSFRKPPKYSNFKSSREIQESIVHARLFADEELEQYECRLKECGVF